jgi:hypothetical protein
MSEPPAPPPPPPGAAPPPPPGWTEQRWYSLQGITTALVMLLWTSVGLAVLGLFAYVNRVRVINDILDSASSSDLQSRADDADSFVGAVVILLSLATLAIAVLIIIWTFRAMKNAEYNGRYNGRFTPGWGIAGWLIPCANLVIPVLIFQDLWRGSDPDVPRGDPNWRRAHGSALVGWWWGTYVLSALRFGIGNTSDEARTRSDLRDLRQADSIAVVGLLSSIIAAILLTRVLRHIVARQEVTRDRVY